MIDIISLAKEAGLGWDNKYHWYVGSEQLKEFARLIAAAEREACAKVCEEMKAAWMEWPYDGACVDCANAIRARSLE